MSTSSRGELGVVVPRAVVRAFASGLLAHARGEGGAGLRLRTVREASAVVETGVMSLGKLSRLAAWHARHGASPAEVAARRRASPARTAWLLWGGDIGRRWALETLAALGGGRYS